MISVPNHETKYTQKCVENSKNSLFQNFSSLWQPWFLPIPESAPGK